MSLIVARQVDNNVLIVSDTKLTDDAQYKNRELTEEQRIAGVVKSVIIKETICISWAGGDEDAEKAFKAISPDAQLGEIIQILLDSNKKSNCRTPFILCTSFPNREIYEIKNNKAQKVPSAWIRDIRAFNKFQKDMAGKEVNIFTMSSALNNVIDDSTIESVGGFNVGVSINQNKFKYHFYLNVHREPMNISLQLGKPFLIGHGTAESGAYSFNFIGASDDNQHLAIHIRQNNLGIIYSRKLGGLLCPEFKTNINESAFYNYIRSTYKIFPALATENTVQNSYNDAIITFNKKEYANAIILLDKAIHESNGIKKAEMLFYKGKACHYLKMAESEYLFKQAVEIDPTYFNKIKQFLRNEAENSKG